MNYLERRNVCHARSYLMRLSAPDKHWPKHFLAGEEEKYAPPASEQMADDWVEFDPRYPDGDGPETLHFSEPAAPKQAPNPPHVVITNPVKPWSPCPGAGCQHPSHRKAKP